MMKRSGFSLDQLKASPAASINRELIAQLEQERTGNGQQGKRSKYGSRKALVDGILFDSGKEAGRYCQLKLMERAGIIIDLQLQVAYELNPGGTHSLRYIADFVYIITDGNLQIVEDAKGFRTKDYRKKKRLMKKVHGIEIKEV